MLKTAEVHGWSVCLAAEWPKIIEREDVLVEKRITMTPEKVMELAQPCQR